jgi:hypothetical protein
LEDDFEDSLSMVDMGPVSDSEASGSEFDSAASESYESDGDEDAENAAETAPSTEPSADVSASAPEAPRAPDGGGGRLPGRDGLRHPRRGLCRRSRDGTVGGRLGVFVRLLRVQRRG